MVNNTKTVYEFDNNITAPMFGFKSADDYYKTADLNLLFPNIKIPLLCISSQKDPVCSIKSLDENIAKSNENVFFNYYRLLYVKQNKVVMLHLLIHYFQQKHNIVID